jgi:hypothetical protein
MPQIGICDFRIIITMIITSHYEEILDFLDIAKDIMEVWSSD